MISIKKIAIASAVAAVVGLAALAPFGTSSMASADGGSKPGARTTSIDSDRIQHTSEGDQVLSLIMARVKNRADLQALDTIVQQGRLVAISPDTLIIAVPDARTQAAALEAAALIEQVLAEMVGSEVGVEFVIDDPLSNQDDKGGGNEETDDSILGGGGAPGGSGGHLPGGSGSGGDSEGNACNDSRLDMPGGEFARGLMDGDEDDNPAKEEEPKEEPKKEEPKDEGEENKEGENGESGENNGNNNGNGNGNANGNANSGEKQDEGVDWDAVGDAIVNFLKGVAGALTGFFGGAAMSQPTDVEGARDIAEGVDSLDRHRETGTGNKHAAEQLKQSEALQDHPDIGGSSDPCEGYNWFRQALPYLTGTPWDPYARVDMVMNGDPSEQSACGPEANPGPDRNCEREDYEEEPDLSGTPGNGLGPDCDNVEGCGQPAITPAMAEKVMRFSDPTNPCGLYSNVGPDGDCGGESEDEDVPSIPQPQPDCEVCSVSNIGSAGTPGLSSGSVSNMTTSSTSQGLNDQTSDQISRGVMP